MNTQDVEREGFDPARLFQIDEWMARNVENGRYTGSSILLARNGKIVLQSCTGLKSLADNTPYRRDTIVRIYSMTKMITTVAFMTLVERGLVHLDAPVSDFVPEFTECRALISNAENTDQTEPAPSPTLHQLLTHTSGMTYDFNPGLVGQLYAKTELGFRSKDVPLKQAISELAKLPLAFQPGSAWEYSVGIDVIGRVIEVIAGQPFDQFLKATIFDPLDMRDTAFDVPEDKLDRFGDCYTKTETNPLDCSDQVQKSEYLPENVVTYSGGGGLVSTLDDYFKFGEMVRLGGGLNGTTIISPRTMAFMRRNHLPGDIASMGVPSFTEMSMEGMGFGLGGGVVLQPALTGSPASVGDFGWGGLASTYFWTDPVEQLTCIFFTQLIPSSSYPTRAELKALVHAALSD